MTTQDPDPAEAGRSGSVELRGRSWRWRAWRRPAEEGNGAPSPFLEWWEVRFRREDDPAQEARVRAGVPGREWAEETVRSVLRSARERTWRDEDGALWTIRMEGWSARGISTEVAEGAEEDVPTLVFTPGDGGEDGAADPGREDVRRRAGEVTSLTAAGDDELQALLEGREAVLEDD